MRTIDNLETADAFVSGLTLEQEDASSLLLVVANKSVRAQLRPSRRETGGDDSYGAELLFTPQATQIAGVSGARFRSAEAGQPARVIAILTGPGEPQLVAGVPFLQQITGSGQAIEGGGGGVNDVARASADLGLSGALQDVPGAAVAVNPSAAAVAIVTATFDFVLGTGAIVRGHLDVDGVQQAGRVTVPATSPGNDHFATQVWKVDLTAGAHTLKLRALLEGGGASSLRATDTAIAVQLS